MLLFNTLLFCNIDIVIILNEICKNPASEMSYTVHRAYKSNIKAYRFARMSIHAAVGYHSPLGYENILFA